MSTVNLICTTCGIMFSKNKHEVSRRSYKTNSINWFCSRSCSAKYGNLKRTNRTPLPTRWGNAHNIKYLEYTSWYVARCAKDSRRDGGVQLCTDRLEFSNHIESIWTGACALTKVKIARRDRKGNVDETNPFFIASLDRIDSSKPYEIGNVQWVSLAINHAKSSINNFEKCWNDFVAAIS